MIAQGTGGRFEISLQLDRIQNIDQKTETLHCIWPVSTGELYASVQMALFDLTIVFGSNTAQAGIFLGRRSRKRT
jgi:hypothetical protein